MHGIFVFNRMEVYTKKYGHDWSIVAPVPYFPKLPFRTSQVYDRYARVPREERFLGRDILHPKYLVTPKIGMRFYGDWFTRAVREAVTAIHSRHPIDLIDGHYIFPDGTAAARLGRELGIPVILSARGTDLNLYPKLPPIAPLLRENLDSCGHVICVCTELKTVAMSLGVPGSKATVIGNGVDTARFRPGNRQSARKALNLKANGQILMSAGGMVERKGFHILIEAFARLERGDATLIIIGDGQERDSLQAQASRLKISDRVVFPGAIANAKLSQWYQAADLFFLASSREGWPNVLCEAQACGLPCVATRAWGMPEIISDERLGLLVDERNADHFGSAMKAAMEMNWDRTYIAESGGRRTWDSVADNLEDVFGKVRNEFKLPGKI